jgi:hypothetical protein
MERKGRHRESDKGRYGEGEERGRRGEGLVGSRRLLTVPTGGT